MLKIKDNLQNAVVEFSGHVLKIQTDAHNKEHGALYLKKWRSPQAIAEPDHIRTICLNKVLFKDCCQEVYEYVKRCSELRKLLLYNVRDSNKNNTVVILGLSFALRHLNKLQLLVLRDMDIDQKDGKELFLALSSPDLRVLDLANTRIPDCGSELSICLARLSNLSYLNLNNSNLTTIEISTILQTLSDHNTSLTGLILHENNLAAVGELLAGYIGKLPFLRVFGIWNCHIHEPELIRIIGNTSEKIEILDVGKNGKITSTAGLLHDLIKVRNHLLYMRVSKNQFSLLDEKMMEALMVRKRGRLLVNEIPIEYNKLISGIAEECLKY